MSKCAQCGNKMKWFKLLQGGIDERGEFAEFYWCKQPECPNYRLVQVEE